MHASGTWVPKSTIDDALEKQSFTVAAQTVAGITAPITRLCRWKGKESIFQKKLHGDELHYRVNPIYLKALKALMIRET